MQLIPVFTASALPKFTRLLSGLPVLFCSLLVLLLSPLAAHAQFAGGDGSRENPWQIASAEQLDAVRDDLAAHYVLIADIDLGVAPWNEGSGWTPLGDYATEGPPAFTGSFDGQHHRITGLTIHRPSRNLDTALFGRVTGGIIRAVHLESVSVTGMDRVGALVGALNSGLVYASSATGQVTGVNGVGGLVGNSVSAAAIIADSFASVTVAGDSNVGGLLGSLSSGLLSNSYARSDVSVSGQTAGGLVGNLGHGVVRNSFAAGTMAGAGADQGGLVGEAYVGRIEHSFWDNDIADLPGVASVFAGYQDVTGLSSADFQTRSVFTDAGWNVDAIWHFDDGLVHQWSIDHGSVGEANSPPLLFPALADQQGRAGSTYSLQLGNFVIDPDGDSLSFSVTGAPDGVVVDDLSGELSGLPTNLDTYDITVLISDSAENTVSISFTLTILPAFDGSGTEGDPWQVATADQLHAMRSNLSGHYELTADIDLGTSPWNEGPGWLPVGTGLAPFTGSLDGAGYTISSLFIDRTGYDAVGLLGSVNGAVVQNIHIKDAAIKGEQQAGALIGYALNATISNSSATGSVEGGSDAGSTGGLAGYFYAGSITNSYAMATVLGSATAGGLVGATEGPAMVSGGYALGSVRAEQAGGLIGHMASGGQVQNSYARGSVAGSRHAGGLIGSAQESAISHSYALVSVTGNTRGGLLGQAEDMEISHSYWSTTLVNGMIGDAIGDNNTGSSAGLTSTQMQSAGNYAGLDFDTRWSIEGATYPYLQWAQPPVFRQPPVQLAALPSQQVLITDTISLDISSYFDSVDNETLTFTATNLPEGVTFSAAGMLGGTAGQAATTVIQISVSDGYSTVTAELSLTVLPFIAGDGSPEDPWQIASARALDAMRDYPDSSFRLTADIDLDDAPWNAGTGWQPVGTFSERFTGTLNGAGHTISNLFIARSDQDDVGLFGYLNGATVSHLLFERLQISGQSYVGALAGQAVDSTISQISVHGEISGQSHVGGMVGRVQTTTLSESQFSGTASATQDYVGGLVAIAHNSAITNSFVYADLSADEWAGGLVGLIDSGALEYSYARGTTTANTGAGGLIADRPDAAMTLTALRWEVGESELPAVGAGVPYENAGLDSAAMRLATSFPAWNLNTIWVNHPAVNDAVPALRWLLPDNVPPYLGAVTSPLLRLDEDTSVSINFAHLMDNSDQDDLDGNVVAFRITGVSGGSLSIDGSPFHVSGNYSITPDKSAVWTPAANTNGLLNVFQVLAIDDTGAASPASAPVQFQVDAVNDVPQRVTPVGNRSGSVGSAFSLDVSGHFSDVDGDELAFDAGGLPAGLTISVDGQISGIPAEGTAGAHAITISASDPDQASASDTFTLMLFTQGDGSEADPWGLNSAAQLDAIRSNPEAHYRLTGDIDLASDTPESPFYDDGAGWRPIGTPDTPFTGSFDGRHYVISGLHIRREALFEFAVGLFGYTQGARIENVILKDVEVHGLFYAGGLVGYLAGGDVSHSQVSGNISTQTGEMGAGGVVGAMASGIVSNSLASGTVQAVASTAGGLVGAMSGAGSEINNSYSRSQVVSDAFTGGLVGTVADGGLVRNSYANGAVSDGFFNGAVAGMSTGIVVTASFWNSDQTQLPGVAAFDMTGIDVTGLAAEELKQGDALVDADWDMASIWALEPELNDGFPVLAWQVPANRPPELQSAIDDLFATQGVAFTYYVSQHFTDPDGDALQFSATGLPSGITIDTDGLITGRADNNGVYNVRITATDPDAALTSADLVMHIALLELPADSAPVIETEVTAPTINRPVTVGPNGVINGGTLNGDVDNQGLLTGDLHLGQSVVITGGIIEGTVIGSSAGIGTEAGPATIVGSVIRDGSRLENVLIGPGTIIDPGVEIGPDVRFASGALIPAGLDITEALATLAWLDGDAREVVDLDGDVAADDANPLSLIRAIQLLSDFEPSGHQILQRQDNGELYVVIDGTANAALPVKVTQAATDDTEGLSINEDGDIVFVTAERRLVVSYPVLIDKTAFLNVADEMGLGLTLDGRINLILSENQPVDSSADSVSWGGNGLSGLSAPDWYYIGRADVAAIPAGAGSVAGLTGYPVPGLPDVEGVAIIFEADDGRLMQQALVPVPADWFAVKAALQQIPGASDVRIDLQGTISMRENGQLIRARADYLVQRDSTAAVENGGLRFEHAGDINDDGVSDYYLVYANGDRQVLYVMP